MSSTRICVAALVTVHLFVTAANAQSPAATKPADSKSTKPATSASARKPTAKAPAATAAKPVTEIDLRKSVYVVPMGTKEHGMFGLDIHPQAYELIAKDIIAKRPDIVVFVLNSADIDAVRYLGDDPRKFGIFDDDTQRKMSRDLKEAVEKVGAEAIMIIRDAVGYSALLGLSWPNMYMTDSARLMGLDRIQERTNVEDPEVHAKFREAFVGICNGFLISGGYNQSIGLAMMRPEKKLSASFKGREVNWTEDDKGTVLVDGSDKYTAQFNAESAELLGLSDGTVSDDALMIEDLMYQRGYRSFRRMNEGEVLVNDYIDGWHKALADCAKAYPEYQEALSNAQGKEEKKYVQKAKSILESVISKIKKYKAVEIMLNKEFGITRIDLDTEVLKLQERIKGLGKSTAPPASGGGRKGGGGGLGPGSSITGASSPSN